MSDSTHGASSSAAAQSTSTAPSTPSLQQEDGNPSVPGGDSGRDVAMNLILKKNFLGVHKLRVRQVKTTNYTRPINARGLNKLKKSISERDWGSSYTPYVLVPREQVPSGKDTVFSPEFLETLTVYCLDGNHRVVALSQVKGADYMVECRLYLHFDCERTITTLALNINEMRGDSAETTSYDRIYGTMKIIKAVMSAKGLTDPSKVSARMLAEACKLGGQKPPTNPQLCQDKRLALGFTDEAFAAMKAVAESEDKEVDISCLSKHLLDNKIVLEDLKKHPQEQTLLVNILARYKFYNNKVPPKISLLPTLKQRAMEAGKLYRLILTTIPLDAWTPAFLREFEKLFYHRQSEWETYGAGHLSDVDKDVEHFEGLLENSSHTLLPEHIETIKAKLPSELLKIAKKSADLRPHYDAWEQRMAEVSMYIKDHENVHDSSSSSSCSSSEDEEDEDEDEDDNEEDDEDDDEATSKRPSKKRKKDPKSTLAETEPDPMETSRSRSIFLHPGLLFTGSPPKLVEDLGVRTPPKLVILDLTRQGFLLKDTVDSKRMLKRTLQTMVNALHPQGTMAIAIPRPWHSLGAAIINTLSGLTDVELEDHPLVIYYNAVSGGALKKGKENHIRSQLEQVLLVRRPCPPDRPFTCNKRVVVSDVFGHSSGRYPHNKQVLHLEALPAGAPNGGSRTFFPPKAAQYLIGRFTNATDTVMCVGVETTTVAEVAIDHARCVECFILEEDARASLEKKMTDAFRTAHGRGLFQSQLGREVVVGPNLLPSGLPESLVPPRVATMLEAVLKETEDNNHLKASFAVAIKMAKECNFDLKGGADGDNAELRAKKKKRNASAHPNASKAADIPVWGKLVVYATPVEARKTLDDDEVDEQFVRLLQIADNAQLRLMLERGSEVCGHEAAVYLRVDATCPVYWLRWDDRKDKSDLDVVCSIPHQGSRSAILERVQMNVEGAGGVRVRHARNKPTETSAPTNLLVSSSCGRIVGSELFPPRSSSRLTGSECDLAEEKDEGENLAEHEEDDHGGVEV